LIFDDICNASILAPFASHCKQNDKIGLSFGGLNKSLRLGGRN
jgi:hypothetical protein